MYRVLASDLVAPHRLIEKSLLAYYWSRPSLPFYYPRVYIREATRKQAQHKRIRSALLNSKGTDFLWCYFENLLVMKLMSQKKQIHVPFQRLSRYPP